MSSPETAEAIAQADFCITLNFDRHSEGPSRIFQVMVNLIDAFQEIDRALAGSIDSSIEPVLMLEDIEAGSLKAWFRTVLDAIPDDALKDINWRKAVGTYLVKAKYRMINWTAKRATVTDRNEVIELQRDLLDLAEETDVRHIPTYAPVPPKLLVEGLQKVSDATSTLRKETESASYETRTDEPVNFNMSFGVAVEALEELLTKETIENHLTLILKVKKPDYLGESQWDLKHENRTIPVKILDEKWLTSFQVREKDVRPGDALRAKVTSVTRYGFDGEVVGTSYTVTEVLEIVRAEPESPTLPGT